MTVSVDVLRETYPDFPPWIQTESGLESPLGQWFVEQFLAMPDEPTQPKQLRSSRFEMSEYAT